MNPGSPASVAVFGAGIAGLTVAHECADAGLDVRVFEAHHLPGGKALSLRCAGLPVEHSLRTFQSSYSCLFETMTRIPCAGGSTVFDRLRPLHGFRLISSDPGVRDWRVRLDMSAHTGSLSKARQLQACMRQWGVPPAEVLAFLAQLLDYMTMSDAGRRRHVAPLTFAEYAGFDRRSKACVSFLTSLAEISVAAKPTASAQVVMDLFTRLFAGTLLNDWSVDSALIVLDGPTGERWIEPWVEHLDGRGVRFAFGSKAEALVYAPADGRLSSVRLAGGEIVAADFYVLALPLAELQRLFPQEAPTRPAHAGFHEEWSGGFQFPIASVPPALRDFDTFTLSMGSPWGVVGLLESNTLWPDTRFPPNVAAVLSVTASNMERPGRLFGKPLYECTPEEVRQELLAQLGLAIDPLILGFHVDPWMRYLSDAEYRLEAATTYHGWRTRPVNPDGSRWIHGAPLSIAGPEVFIAPIMVQTSVSNLLLAGEYVDSPIHTPNMERANQSGKLCAIEILKRLGLPYPSERFRPARVNSRLLRAAQAVRRRLHV
jgi:hypothetical protein